MTEGQKTEEKKMTDGKYNITNDFGGTLHEYIGKKQALDLMHYVDEINMAYGGEGTRLYSTAGTKFKKTCMQNDLHLLDASVRHLGIAYSGIINGQYIQRVFLSQTILVQANDGFLTAIDISLTASCALFDTQFIINANLMPDRHMRRICVEIAVSHALNNTIIGAVFLYQLARKTFRRCSK